MSLGGVRSPMSAKAYPERKRLNLTYSTGNRVGKKSNRNQYESKDQEEEIKYSEGNTFENQHMHASKSHSEFGGSKHSHGHRARACCRHKKSYLETIPAGTLNISRRSGDLKRRNTVRVPSLNYAKNFANTSIMSVGVISSKNK